MSFFQQALILNNKILWVTACTKLDLSQKVLIMIQNYPEFIQSAGNWHLLNILNKFVIKEMFHKQNKINDILTFNDL